MADEPSLLKEDGYLNVEPNLKQIIYHPSLNVILICTDIEVVHVLDVNSGVVLQSSRLCAKENSKVTCKYLPGQDKVLFCDGYGIGVRSDYNGVLLLDTILQKPVATPKDVIKLELLLSEAILLKQNLLAMTQFVIEQLPEVIKELCNKISEAQRQTKKGIKAQKWNTVCLDLPLELLKRVAEVTVSEFTLKNQHVPELAVAAAVQERLNELLNESPTGTDKSAMASEARRLDTFSRWPHMDYKWALPEQMAQAGFYHQPNNSGDDRAMCFTCNVCLVCWERTDEPWSEHERHSPNCPFVMGEYTQNVPLSVTYATAPALDATYRGQAVNLVGSSSVSHLVATATSDGLITVYDVAGKLRATHAFYVTQFDSPVLECCLREFGRGYSWMTRDEGRSLTLSALCVVGEPRTIGTRTNRDDTDKSTTDDHQQQQQIIATTTQSDANKGERVRPAVICGLTLRGWYQGSNQGSEAAYIEDVGPREPITCLCLALYDFQYTKDAERLPETVIKRNTSTTNPSNNTGGTTNNNTSSSTTTQLSTAAKQNILLSFMNELNCGVAGGDLAFINDVHYQAMQFIKQAEPHNYHNLIPGESDDIYLPPAMRLLVDEEPDAATTATANNYALLNGQVSDDGEPASTGAQLPNVTTTIAATNDKGISDHITELKSSKTKRLDYSHAVQCVPLPAAYKRQLDLEIVDVLPTRDSSHVLVVLRSISGQGSSALLLYPLSLVGPVVRLAETPSAIRDLPPSHCPLEVSVVVPVATGASIEAPSLEGSAVLVCADGAVRIYDLLTLKPSCVAKLDTDNFVSAVYCNSLERLCAATASGSLHFYALNDVDSELGDDHDDEQLLNAMSTSSPGATGNSSTVTDSWSSSSRPDATMSDSGVINEYPLELTVSDLRYMHSLCAFEPTSASYCVVVPPCWSEMQQAQRQRRHPQYLSGDEQHTRTWRLQTDTTTWDEHMFELTLPAPATIGHMDVHFSLHGQHTNPPHVELTLLRQHTSGIGHRRAEVHFQVDETISFECLQRNQNPVTSREYLRSHNADILAGPIQLADCLDLTDQSGCVTLTSPKLFKASTRTLLLHIKALCDPSNEHHALRKRKSDANNTAAPSSGGGGVGTNNITSAGTATGTTGLEGTTSSCSSSSSSTATNNTNKAEYYMGCDCLHELSITLYRARHADVSAERMQRSTMLESNQVLAALLRAPLNGASTQQQSLAFHVLLWVASIRLARNRGPGNEAPAHQLECLRTIEPQLGALLQQCVLRAGRSIAHKCVKFIIVCSDGARNISESVGRQFDDKVFEALMHCLPEIGRMWSAGALHWLVVLILRVSREHQHSTLATHCISLLSQLAQEMSSRANLYHLLLRTRFGLFGTPLEPELFDMEAPVPAKPTSVPLTYASVMTTGETIVHPQLHNSLALTEPPLDTKELLSAQPADWKLRLRAMAPTKHMRGLLETEPLHFTCVAASDGTRVERFDPNTPPVNVCGFYGSMPTNTPPQQSQHQQQHSGTKKADADDMNVSLTDLDITPDTLNPTVIYEKEMTQLLLSADLHKGSHDCWPILGNKIDGLAMTVDDIDPMNTADFLISNNSGGSTGNGGEEIVGAICGGVTVIQSGSSNGSGEINGCKPSNNNASKAAVAAAAAAAAAAAWPRPSDHHMDMLSPQSGHCSLQQLLITPPQQVMVVERMQSGARRFVTLDFGAPVLLTDVLIPACHDLVSLSLDLWLRGEDIDAVRLVLATDIGTKTLVLSDLQPPPICRYIKITTIGRYGMSTTRCRIPIGHFYGHMVMVADEMIGVEGEPIIGPSDVDSQLNMLNMLLEDVNCRYSLACSRLKELLQPLLASDIPNTVHMTVYMGMVRDSLEQTSLPADTAKVLSAYQEATMYQRQLNVVHGFIRRIEGSLGLRTSENNNNSNSCVTTCSITEACSDKVRALAESLLDIVLSVSVDVTIDRDTCEQLFQGLCVAQAPRLQMLTATLLVRTCGRQPFWGSFIADTLARMFSSGHTGLFPLDRVFVLLTYLGRRSPERALVLDATLRVLAEVVAPLARPQPALLASRADLSLLGWILLYLSMQLDGGAGGSKNDTPASRWGWLTADSSLRPNDATLCPSNPRRKLQRRFSQYKHQFENIDWTKTAVTTSTPVQALSALSSQAASLSTKLEAAFKQQESVFKRIKQYSKSKDLNMMKQEGSGASGSPKTGRSGGGSAPEPDDGAITSLDPDHCLAVTRGLVSLLLTMDHSCSADMFLLACKVVGRLVTSARLSMWQLLTIEQLQQLMRTCVRSEQPWMQHALACLLQDMLDVASASTASSPAPTHTTDDTFVQTTNTIDMDTDSQAPGPGPGPGPGPSWKPTNVAPELFEAYVVPHKFLISGKSNSNPLPSVYESDDSELDDFLDDILERGRSLLRRNGSNNKTAAAASAAAAAAAAAAGSISSAMDARLELGVDAGAETRLRRLTSLATGVLFQPAHQTVTSPSQPQQQQQNQQQGGVGGRLEPPPWPETLIQPWALPASLPNSVRLSNHHMVAACFNSLFGEAHLQSATELEHTLRLWLTLNRTSAKGNFIPVAVAIVPLAAPAVASLVNALVRAPYLSLRAWCVALQALTLCCNLPAATSDWLDHSLAGMATSIVAHPDFVPMLLRLLAHTGLSPATDNSLAGPPVCRALHDLLVRLMMRCDVVTPSSNAGVRLKEHLLRLVYQLVQPGGPLALRQGPLDVQCKFVQCLLNLDFSDTNLAIVMCILESTGILVSSYVSNVERIQCVNLGERNGTAATNFSGLYASVLGNQTTKQDRPATWEALLIALLKLLTRLVQTPLPQDGTMTNQSDAMDTETVQSAQTDESKAERKQEGSQEVPTRVPCLADNVLLHHASIMRLCESLAACSGSSLTMIAGCAPPTGLADFDVPGTVGDAVFQLLSVMTHKTSKPELILQPLVQFLKSAKQLSEPLLWFILQVLNNEQALIGFLELDGVTVLAESMVRSTGSLSAVPHGTISLLMHHMASTPSVNTRSDPTISYAGTSLNKKMQQANMENAEALINFAPMASIRCHGNTTQSADVLIQSAVASHRRARTPQWCYHFSAEESYTDLSIRLPCAVLLREVQLQPHLSTLSTCPSAVALEVSNGSPDHLMPASPPLPTSGMTFIRLHLPLPEVVTHVLLRLYKPRDASNIGLSQIRLLGTSAFGGLAKSAPTSDVCDEEAFSKFSLGWLRLLHHCFMVPVPDSALERRVVAAAARVPHLLVTCCGLLLVPTHIPPLYLPNLERVLCKLSLHDRESGLAAIRMLLGSRAALCGATNALLTSKTSTTTTHSVCELLHQVCEHQDPDTMHRVTEVLDWLGRSAAYALTHEPDSCSPAFVSCIASILWSAKEVGVSFSLDSLIQPELFQTVFTWSQLAGPQTALKAALDRLLCSLCYIRTSLFPVLLQRMSVLVPNLSTDRTASISDDRKDSESMTDDHKQDFENESEWYGRLIIGDLSQLNLSEEQLETIAMVSRSPPGIQQLLDSGLPKLLVRAILEFCTCNNGDSARVPMARVESVTSILRFFGSVCVEQSMRDWLGSVDGAAFWLPLLQWLCQRPAGVRGGSRLRTEMRAQLEEACVRFLAMCCLCHRHNQRLLAKVLCDVIGQQQNGISGFLRRLVLQLLLENEKVLVCVKADETIYETSPLPQPAVPFHPSHKRTHDRALLLLGTNLTIRDILEQHISFATSLKPEVKSKESNSATAVATAAAAAVAAAAAAAAATAAGGGACITQPPPPPPPSKSAHKTRWEFPIDDSDHISVAAGVTAKDKRVKDVKNQALSAAAVAAASSGSSSASSTSAAPQLKKKRFTVPEKGVRHYTDAYLVVRCEALPDQVLPHKLTLAQLLALLEGKPGQPDIHLTITHNRDDKTNRIENESLLEQRPIANTLQMFSSLGGLALLAQHLPTVYPEIVRPAAEKPSNSEQIDLDWVKVDGNDELYDELEEIGGTSTPTKTYPVVANVPPHSLSAFGLFLRLPGYAEVLLKDSKKALCLLRLVLGVTDDGEGGDIFMSPVADSLPTLPFEVLRQLYDSTPLGTDDGRLLRTISINIGVTQLLLTCLAVFTHQVQPLHGVAPETNNQPNKDVTTITAASTRTDDKGQLYWAKGTGFGTGSTQQSWNVEQALLRQRSEEEHVTVLLQVLASYINPGGSASDELADSNVLPATFEQQLSASCLLAALSSYLRNDSVLDMARHIPLYGSVLQLLRAMALSQQLVPLLLPRPGPDLSKPPSIVALLQKMKSCVDNYTCRLRFNKNSSKQFKFAKFTTATEETDEPETDEGLALLMPDIQETAQLVQQATNQMLGSDDADTLSHARDALSVERPLQQSLEQRYLDIMRRLQFDTYEMICEVPDGYKFVVSYHFEGNVRSAGEQSQPARVKRLAQEAVTLATSLPLSYSSSVFVRCDTDRLDIMKVLITGPADTPYANGCFELDVYFPPDYPNAPMMINLETTGHHTVRFNPNLYNDGKVCLSVLNTWHGRPEEKWNAHTSSFLQVLVSIQSLILVPEPYFNEPGYERSRGTPSGTQSSREYNANIWQATVRWAMLEQIVNPCPCFKDVIHTHFWLKRHEVLAQVESWIADLEAQLAEKRATRTASKRNTLSNLDTFKKNFHQLRDQLAKLRPPDGIDDLSETTATPSTASVLTNASTTTTNITATEIDTDIEMEKLVSDVVE